jgi:hypothetical protein
LEKRRNHLDPLDRATGNSRDSAEPAFETVQVSYSLGKMKLSQMGSFVISISVIKYPRNTVAKSYLVCKQYFWGDLEPIMVKEQNRTYKENDKSSNQGCRLAF